MRFGFVTCVQLGLSCMEAIYEVGGSLDLVLTLEDNMARAKSGRAYVDTFCDEHGIYLTKIRNINESRAVEVIRACDLDWLFIIGWSQIAREDVLSSPRRGVIGIHPTLLPIGRGRAAIPWAIIKGLEQTGVTMFQLDAGVDTGPMIAQRVIPLSSSTDAAGLYEQVEHAHIEMMREVFPKLRDGLLEPAPQNECDATVWPGRTPEDGLIDAEGSVFDAERLIRATTRPYPGAYIDLPDGRLRLWRAHVVSRDGPNSRSPDTRSPVISFSDGSLVADEWEWEEIPE